MGRNNSRQASSDSFLPSAFRRMCSRKTCMAAKGLLASFHYRPLQNLIKKDDHGSCHGGCEPSFHKDLCRQSDTNQPFSLAGAREHVALLGDEPGHKHTLTTFLSFLYRSTIQCRTRPSAPVTKLQQNQPLLYIKG